MLGRVLLVLFATCAARASEPGDPAALALEAGKRALAEHDPARAAEHFRNALVHRPASAEILGLLLETTGEDQDARALWSVEWALAALQENGELPFEVPAFLPWAGGLAQARAAAFSELASFAEEHQKKAARACEELLVARWARRAALDLAHGSHGLETRAATLSPELVLPRAFHEPVLAALQKALSSALAARRSGEAIRVARCLSGLATQASFHDLQGEKPSGLGRIGEIAAEGLSRARAELAARGEAPWTVAELEEWTAEQGEAFTREHASFAAPGLALSPQAWYRIETDCGSQTLLGVASTIEDHHRRLASWFGEDPFVQRQGTVRVVHEAADLEAEGAPFFWVGGFQSGDVTVGRLACGTIEGFGRLLTHELTHRFDGAIYPGEPAWLAEGKAVWTGAAYGHSTDERFVENHASFGTVEAAFIKGYGATDKLERLVAGTVEDYRDNYVAGYALYLYLNTWKENERPLYRERLLAFMESGRASKLAPKERFLAHFCDGKEGRPATLEDLAARYGEFLSGFYWKTPKPFTQAYTQSVPGGSADGWVYDEPTWTWARERAEPVFGQEQARLAGELLLELERKSEGARALVWALASDGPSPFVAAELARALDAPAQKGAAWVLERERTFPHAGGAAAPFLAALPKARALLELHEQTAAELETQGALEACAALRAERDRIAAWLGVAPISRAATAVSDPRRPFDRPARDLGFEGWEESGLTGYEERRQPGLWYADENGDLHVGREKARTETNRFDRSAHQRDAFVLSKAWLLPGAWRFHALVQFTTSYGSGSIVFGYARRDQNLRLDFSAGDFLYAIGESETEPTFESVSWGLHGLYVRDGPLAGSQSGGTLAFENPKTSFELEIVVSDAMAHVFLDGQRVATYHSVDGAPIEGRIGFATGMGAIRVVAPTIQRLDRSAWAGRLERVPIGVDLARGLACPFQELVNRDLIGLERATNGTVLLWIPGPSSEADEQATSEDWLAKTQRSIEKIALALERRGTIQPFVVAVPAAMGEETITALRKALAEENEAPPRVIEHVLAAIPTPDGPVSPDGDHRWLVFVDSIGVARVVLPYFTGTGAFEERLAHWLRVFQDHGHPPRELPAPERGGSAESGDGEDR